jgi:dGTP triphosphohydrolase
MRHPHPLADSSAAVAPRRQELEAFLHRRVYRHPTVLGMQRRAGRIAGAVAAFRERQDARL